MSRLTGHQTLNQLPTLLVLGDTWHNFTKTENLKMICFCYSISSLFTAGYFGRPPRLCQRMISRIINQNNWQCGTKKQLECQVSETIYFVDAPLFCTDTIWPFTIWLFTIWSSKNDIGCVANPRLQTSLCKIVKDTE